jgi:3-deoxy-D-manno-octulosonic-acid transferase
MRRSLMTWIFDLIYLLAVSVGWPLLMIRRWRRGPGSLALGERMGKVPSRRVSGRCVWIHGVSLGEINATTTLVRGLHESSPDTAVVISSTTATGLERARTLYPELTVFRFPLDFSWVVRRVLRRVRPTVIVLMELEVWPNLMEIARQEGIKLIIANGRVTEEGSMRKFRLPVIRSLVKRMFGHLHWVGAQDEIYASRFVELGVPPEAVSVIGSTKFDTALIADRVEGQDELAAEMGIDAKQALWVCGSTGPGEESQILDAYAELRTRFEGLQLAMVPRKPERFDEVAELIASRGAVCLRRSTGAPHLAGPVDEGAPLVFLGDTMGELRKFYALATVVFVGRSLTPMGGSDMVEVAALAKPMIVGPYTENFAQAMEILQRYRGVRTVADTAELLAAVSELLRHPDRAQGLGQAAREAVQSQRGATNETLEVIKAALEADG